MTRSIYSFIEEVASVKRYYKLNFSGHHGASSDLMWKNEVLMKEGPVTNCVSVSTEILFRIMKDAGYEDIFDIDDMKELLQICFIYDENKHTWGIAQGIVDFQLGYEIEEPSYEGDFGQLWHINSDLPSGFGPEYSHYLGHSVVFLQKIDKYYRHFSASSGTKGPGRADLLIERCFDSGHCRKWKWARLDILK